MPKHKSPASRPIEFTRADPVELALFDPRTKTCTMNCGPHRDDPRQRAERMLLCPECITAPRCPKCEGYMLRGIAFMPTMRGIADFPGAEVVTVSPTGPGYILQCLKCNKCGHSVTG